MACSCFPCGKDEAASAKRTFQKGSQNVTFYSLKQLQTATKNFSQENKIGVGGFGSVYKGRLPGGTEVAVKVLSEESKQGLREFCTELAVISLVEHENLVKLYGCCVEANNRILVYGYLENNSIAQTLLGSHRYDWSTRRNICIGIARGLAYLHEEVRPHIIHRDIKASNILLDKALTAKISDFGLAKLIHPSMTHVSTRIAGTLGYLAPEYALHGQLTRKADIYSFGVLLLEIVCGRRNRDKCLPYEDQYLLEKAWRLHEKGALKDLMDESCKDDVNIEEACRFLKISLLCTQGSPKLRPTASDIVKMLQGDINVSRNKISKPGLLSELMSMKGNPESGSGTKNTSSTWNPSSGPIASDNIDTTCASITFTSISQRNC